MKKIIINTSILGIALFLLYNFYGLFFNSPLKQKNRFLPLRVAHAGGGIDGITYTNSLEALNANFKKGFRYFEIDFSFTKDNKLVCLHDWHHTFEKYFGLKTNKKLTLKAFKLLIKSKKSKYTHCTLGSLSIWMKKHPSAYLITDVKERNIEALGIIHKTIPDASKKVIPQIYNPENFKIVKSFGYNQIIWTLYRYGGSNELVLDWVNSFNGSFAITMPAYRAKSTLPKDLLNINVPTYVHTINSIKWLKKYKGNGISEIYTDFLKPSSK